MQKLSDKNNMSIKEMLPIIFGVLKNLKVIGTTIAMILVIAFTNFIIRYKKKDKPIKPKKAAAPAPAPEGDTGPKPDMSENDA